MLGRNFVRVQSFDLARVILYRQPRMTVPLPTLWNGFRGLVIMTLTGRCERAGPSMLAFFMNGQISSMSDSCAVLSVSVLGSTIRAAWNLPCPTIIALIAEDGPEQFLHRDWVELFPIGQHNNIVSSTVKAPQIWVGRVCPEQIFGSPFFCFWHWGSSAYPSNPSEVWIEGYHTFIDILAHQLHLTSICGCHKVYPPHAKVQAPG
jgi:hypothetical protein